jgi:formamidopyrimidine-DNA glycosylase
MPPAAFCIFGPRLAVGMVRACCRDGQCLSQARVRLVRPEAQTISDMPELPEVETVRRDLLAAVQGRTVLGVRLHRRDVVVGRTDPPGGWSRQRKTETDPAQSRMTRVPAADLLDGCQVVDVQRHGKHLAIFGVDPRGVRRVLGAHLGMTGHFELVAPGKTMKPAVGRHAEHVHVSWRFEHGRLVFADPRRFGGLRVFADSLAHDAWLAELGPDALGIDGASLADRLAHTRRAIKAALLDQAVIAGVGNIYADESLFHAEIRPDRRAHDLSAAEVDRLATAIRVILAEAVMNKGSSIQSFRGASGEAGRYQGQHRVYDRGGEPCAICQTTLVSDTLGQRTTVWCPNCQQ